MGAALPVKADLHQESASAPLQARDGPPHLWHLTPFSLGCSYTS